MSSLPAQTVPAHKRKAPLLTTFWRQFWYKGNSKQHWWPGRHYWHKTNAYYSSKLSSIRANTFS